MGNKINNEKILDIVAPLELFTDIFYTFQMLLKNVGRSDTIILEDNSTFTFMNLTMTT